MPKRSADEATTSKPKPASSAPREPARRSAHVKDDKSEGLSSDGEEEPEEEPDEDDILFVASDNELEGGGSDQDLDPNIKRKIAMDDDEFVEYYEVKWAKLNGDLDRGRLSQGQYTIASKILELQEREEHKKREACRRRRAKAT